jgi:AcrR family transcriptional regulator
MRRIRVGIMPVLFGRHLPPCEPERPGGDEERSIRARKCLAYGLDGAAIGIGRALEVPQERDVVLERQVDHTVRRGRCTPQTVEIVKRAAMDLGPGGGEGVSRGIRAGQPDDLMAGADELGNDSGADPAGRASDENTHEKTSRWSRSSAQVCAGTDVSFCHHSTMMSAAVISDYDWRMARWEPDSRGRLEQAALALYRERGFENTTVADIAERAGLTERTFFRHFADKREVLFGGAGTLQELFVATVASAPDSAAPIDAVAAALQAAGALLQQRREYSQQRQTVIAASAELRERELIKLAALSSALADALRRRGVNGPAASLTAEAGIAVFRVAFERWVNEANQRDLPRLIRESLDELKAVTAGKR